MDDALFSEALDDFELTAFPFVPSCYISSGFCPTGPTFSTTPTLAPTCSSSLVSSSASGSTAPAPLLSQQTNRCHLTFAFDTTHHLLLHKRTEILVFLATSMIGSKAPVHKKQSDDIIDGNIPHNCLYLQGYQWQRPHYLHNDLPESRATPLLFADDTKCIQYNLFSNEPQMHLRGNQLSDIWNHLF